MEKAPKGSRSHLVVVVAIGRCQVALDIIHYEFTIFGGLFEIEKPFLWLAIAEDGTIVTR